MTIIIERCEILLGIFQPLVLSLSVFSPKSVMLLDDGFRDLRK
jgi:hypothetical protein